MRLITAKLKVIYGEKIGTNKMINLAKALTEIVP